MVDVPEDGNATYAPLASVRKDYWVIETVSMDWLWVINNLIKKVENLKKDDVLLSPGLDPKNPHPTYMLKKATFSADALASAFGVTAAQIKAVKTIRLKPFKQPDDLPAPTVDYYGVA